MGRPPSFIRLAGHDDIPALVALSMQMRAEGGGRPAAGERVRVEALLRRPDVQVLVAATGDLAADDVATARGDAVRGLLVLRRGELIPLGGTEAAHVEQLWVHPDHRRHGIGHALLRHAASIADKSGVDEVVATVAPSAREVHRFLARLGFAPLVSQRVVPVDTLLRRLAASNPAQGRTSTHLNQVLARRRRFQRNRAGIAV